MAELDVPQETLELTRKFLASVAGQGPQAGQFAYQPNSRFNPAMTAGLAAYSRRLSGRATAAQSATATRPVTARRAHATGFNAGEARP